MERQCDPSSWPAASYGLGLQMQKSACDAVAPNTYAYV